MESWKHCGAGFSGVQKLNRIVSLTQNQCQGEETEKSLRDEAKITIVSKDSPDPKKRFRPWGSSKKARQGKVPALVKATWKPDVLRANFNTSAEICPLESDEIECASSSSDNDDADHTEHEDERKAMNINNVQNTKGYLRKRPRQLNEKPLADSSEFPCLKSTDKASRPHVRPGVYQSDASCSEAVQEDAPVKNFFNNQTNPCSNKFWNFSSFANSDQAAGSQLESHRSCKRNVRRDSCGKPKVVRRLHTEPNEGSPSCISDVDSDCEEQEECVGRTHQDANYIQGRSSIEESSPFRPDNCEEHLTPREISPASSPSSHPNDKDNLPLESRNSQVSISSGSSSQSCLSQQRNTIKASEWISALQKEKTPVKEYETHGVHPEDSAKKKRKYASGSLADRLSKMQRRLKSSIRMWSHSAKTGVLSDKEAKSIVVLIQSMDKLNSLCLCDCKTVSNEGGGKDCKVFFSKETAELMALKIGTSVQIYPPWQQLETSAGERTLLCTYFVRSVPTPQTPSSTVKDSPQRDSSSQFPVKARWSCPCDKDPRLPSSLCPSVKDPSIPQVLGKRTDRVSTSPHDGLCGQAGHNKTTLQSVHCVSPRSSLGFLDLSKTVSCAKSSSTGRTLQASKDMLMHGSDILPSFSATVLRVFVQKSFKAGLVKRAQLLLVDSARTVALANFPVVHPGCGEETKQMASDGQTIDPALSIGRLEGKRCTFSGFLLSARITRDQDPSLFSIVQRAWPQHSASSCLSQGEDNCSLSWRDDISDTSQQGTSKGQAIPTFAYVLQAYPGSGGGHVEVQTPSKYLHTGEECGAQKSTDDTPPSGFTHNRLSLMTLRQALQSKDNASDRMTFVAKIAIASGDEDSRAPSSALVYDQFTDESGHTVFHSLHMGNYSAPGRFEPSLCLFRDVQLVESGLQCDAYSLVLPQKQWSAWGLDHVLDHFELALVERLATATLSVPPLSHSTGEGSVVRVEGRINGVDEESACMLEECCVCGSDLIVPEAGSMHCPFCNKDVDDSISVMRMAAFLSCSDIASDIGVKVQLGQKTIEKILPEEADEDGYDVDQVIGKTITCGACLVESNNTATLESSSEKIIFLRELEYA